MRSAVGPIELPRLDPALTKPTPDPVKLSGDLTADQTEDALAIDGTNLRMCGIEKAAIIEGYEDLRTKFLAIQ